MKVKHHRHIAEGDVLIQGEFLFFVQEVEVARDGGTLVRGNYSGTYEYPSATQIFHYSATVKVGRSA
jgi:hypothetical protein